jgi:hypothetical protein
MTYKLNDAILDVMFGIAARQEESSTFIRLEVPHEWPASTAIEALSAKLKILVGPLDDKWSAEFGALDVDVSNSPGQLTQLRNCPSPEYQLVILLGHATGEQQAGLRDLHYVITADDVFEQWKDGIRGHLEANFEEGADRRSRLIVSYAIVEMARRGLLQAQRVSDYLTSCIDSSTQSPQFVGQNLWILGLIPDNALVDASNMKRVQVDLEENQHLLRDLKSDYLIGGSQSKFKQYLLPSAESGVQSLVRWIKRSVSGEGDLSEDLRSSEYRAVQKALKKAKPPKPTSTANLLDGLRTGNLQIDSEDFKSIAEDVDHAVTASNGEIKTTMSIIEENEAAEYDFVLQLAGNGISELIESNSSDEIRKYFENPNLDEVPSVADLSTIPIFVLKLKESSGVVTTKPWLVDSLANSLAPRVDSSVVEVFLEARHRMLLRSRQLSKSDAEVLALLAFSQHLRLEVESYISSWKELLNRALEVFSDGGSADRLTFVGLLDAVWSRTLQPGESVESLKIKRSDSYEAVELLPHHPWRLEPLLQLAVGIAENPQLFGASEWAIERVVPMFRVLRLGSGELNYSGSRNGSLRFENKSQGLHLRYDSSVQQLKRLVRSYSASHPWSSSGLLVNILNFPNGGGLSNLVGYLEGGEFGSGSVGVRIAREEAGTGIDAGLVDSTNCSYFSAPELLRGIEGGRFNADISFAFLPSAANAPVDAYVGGYGSLRIELVEDGLDAHGRMVLRPELIVADNEVSQSVTLLTRVTSGMTQAVAAINLGVPDTQLVNLRALATVSQWLVVAIPAATPPFEISDLKGLTLTRVAELEEGFYKLLVFARDPDAIYDPIRLRLKKGFVGEAATKDLFLSKLNDLLVQLPQRMLQLTQGNFGIEETIGLIVAREVALAEFDEDWHVVELSLDDFSWSRQWQLSGGQRADFVVVGIPIRNTDRQLKVVVVESKGRSDAFEEPRLTNAVFRDAHQQVVHTISILENIFGGNSSKLYETQRKAFIEQLATKVATDYESRESHEDVDHFHAAFRSLTHISERTDEGGGLEISGLCVATFMGGVQAMYRREGELRISLISASERALREILEADGGRTVFTSQTGSNFSSIVEIANGGASSETATRDEQLDLEENALSDPVSGERDEEAIGESAGVNRAHSASEFTKQLFATIRRHSSAVTLQSPPIERSGPTFTSVSFTFERGEKLQPLQAREGDIARDLGVQAVEILNDSSEPGRIQVLVPRKDRETVHLPRNEEYPRDIDSYLPINIGIALDGTLVSTPLAKWPHALVAGTTGSGKTVFLKSMLTQLNDWGSQYSSVILIDGKGENDYILTLDEDMYASEFPEPIFSASDAIPVLKWLDGEISRRRSIINQITREKRVHVDAKGLFSSAIAANEVPIFKPLVVVVDEFNDIMLRGGKVKQQFEDSLTSVAQTARSVMVHMILATQRPDRNVVSGPIKANLGARIAFRLPTAADSMTVLGHGGAERLLGGGDMLFQINGETDQRLQGFFIK